MHVNKKQDKEKRGTLTTYSNSTLISLVIFVFLQHIYYICTRNAYEYIFY